MDAKQIRRLKPMLTRYLKQFDDCFTQRQTRAHFSTYVEGQLSDLGEKSCEPIAVAAGIPPRNLQEFLSTYKWEEDRTRNRLQEIVNRDHAGPNSVGVIDETSDVKQGDKTPGVKRQWCGTVGKTENCIVTVHLGLRQPAISIACWTATCFCPRIGRTTATAAVRRAFPTRWYIGRNGKSRWSFSTAPATTA